MSSQDFIQLATATVAHYYNEHNLDETERDKPITEEDVRIVWLCKVLQNNKAILITDTPDGTLYEFTWNGSREQGYLDVYKKQENIVVRPEWMAD